MQRRHVNRSFSVGLIGVKCIYWVSTEILDNYGK